MPSAFSWLMLVPSSLRLPAPVNQGVRLLRASSNDQSLTVMKRVAKVIGGLLIALLITAAALLYGLSKLGESLCGNSVITESLSPDKQSKVVVFSRDCGATTGFSTQVSIIDASDALPNASGNTFSADTGHGAAPADTSGGPSVSAKWESNDLIVIGHHPATRVFTKENRVANVRINYEHAE